MKIIHNITVSRKFIYRVSPVLFLAGCEDVAKKEMQKQLDEQKKQIEKQFVEQKKQIEKQQEQLQIINESSKRESEYIEIGMYSIAGLILFLLVVKLIIRVMRHDG